MIRTISVLIFCSVCFSYSSTWYMYSPSSFVPVYGMTKSWTKKTPQSWRDWNTRISIGHINFPTNLELPLAFPGSDGKSCEIIIPMDDVVNDEEFVLSPSTPSCPKDARTLPEDDMLWVNPDNWGKSASGQPFPSAVPHIERLPCKYDGVRFGTGLDDFIVILPNKNISIQRMFLKGGYVSRYNYKNFTKREAFVKHFIINSELEAADIFNFTRGDCQDITGCACGTMHLYEEVCAVVKPKCDGNLACPKPVQPYGHCCSICGAYAHITYDPNKFGFRTFFNAISRKFLSESDNFQWHLSKISDGTVQVVFTSDGNLTDNEVYMKASEFVDYVQQDRNLGIIATNLFMSDSVYDPKIWSYAINICLYVLGGVALIIGVFFVGVFRNSGTSSRFVKKPTAAFKKGYTTMEEDNQEEEAEKNGDDQQSDKTSLKDTENETKSKFEDVFVDLSNSNEGEEVGSTLQPKNFQENEILLDVPI